VLESITDRGCIKPKQLIGNDCLFAKNLQFWKWESQNFWI
jgi:hypothetical protein